MHFIIRGEMTASMYARGGGRREEGDNIFVTAVNIADQCQRHRHQDIGYRRWARSSVNALQSVMVFSSRASYVRSRTRDGYSKGFPLPKVPNLLQNTRRKGGRPRYSLPGNLVHQVVPICMINLDEPKVTQPNPD